MYCYNLGIYALRHSKVRRRDGSKVALFADISWAQEFSALWKRLQRKKVSNST